MVAQNTTWQENVSGMAESRRRKRTKAYRMGTLEDSYSIELILSVQQYITLDQLSRKVKKKHSF